MKNTIRLIPLTRESELSAKVKELEAQIVALKIDLKYHEKYLLDGDGHRCEECGSVRYIDDCIRVGDFMACSERCAEMLQRDQDDADERHFEDTERVRRFNNGVR